MKDCSSPSAGEFKELPRLEGMALLSAYQKETEENHLSWDLREMPAPANHCRAFISQRSKGNGLLFLAVVWLPESKVYEQNMGVSWQYSVP